MAYPLLRRYLSQSLFPSCIGARRGNYPYCPRPFLTVTNSLLIRESCPSSVESKATCSNVKQNNRTTVLGFLTKATAATSADPLETHRDAILSTRRRRGDCFSFLVNCGAAARGSIVDIRVEAERMSIFRSRIVGD